jgi:autotransporter-associated beta strand protein
MSQLTAADFQAYPSDTTADDEIAAGPLALYYVPVDLIAPTQMNEGFAEVGKKAAGFDLLTSSELQATLLTDIEPVVIGPDGQLYLLDGHHTFTALEDSIYGASDPNLFVDVVANYSNLTESQFFATMQSNNLLLPLNDGVPQTVNDATGSPIPTLLTELTNDPYRGLEYSILKNKSSKLFTTASNITGAIGATTPGLDKMTGFYSDFLEAAAYRDANGGKGLPYLSPGDIALATQWNLNPFSATTLPNVTGTIDAGQLPGFILTGNITITGTISNSTLANGALDGTKTGTFNETTTFASFDGITEINAGTVANPIIIGTPNTGFILQLGADNKDTVTLSVSNTYTGGTSLLAGTLIIASDASLGAAPGTYTYNQATVKTDVQAANGIIFNGLTEGNPTLQIGTTAGGGTTTFSTSRPIAVGGEVATINVNGYVVTLNGSLVSLGVDGDGIGNATGFSDFTVDDNSSNQGVLILSTPSPDFFGNLIIGNTNKPTVRVTSDAAMGNTTGSAIEIGQVELNGGTFQAGASFTSVRSFFLQSKSTFDTAGYTTVFTGALSDDDRNLTITNSNLSGTGSGAVTFGSFQIDGASELTVGKGSGNSTSVTFTAGIGQTATSDQVLLAGLSSTATVTAGTGNAPTLTNGIVAPWIVVDSGASNNPYDFATYGAGGFTAFTGYASSIASSTSTSVVKQGASVSLSGNAQAYALNIQKGFNITVGTGHVLTLGDGNEAGLILNGGSGSGLTGGTLAFGTAEAYITINGSSTISSAITGSGGLNLAGNGTLTISAVSSESGLVTVNSGTLILSAVNVFSSDAQGLLLQDTKNLATANLTINANNQFAAINSAGNNSSITIASGAALTIGDTTNNLSSTLSSTITETGAATAGALTFDGSGLFDLSGGKIALVAGSNIVVNNSAQLRVAASEFSANTYGVVLNGTSQLQFAQGGGGQFANAISGTGELHLIGGTLQLTGTNTYSGGTVVETGSTLDITTANLPTINENITDAGGLIVFDQSNSASGTFTGVISDGNEMGTGPMLSGSLDKDDSTNDNASTSNLTLAKVQTYTGATYVEAGTLTLNAANTIADSSGVTLGRVGGAVDGQTAGLVLGANNQVTSLSDDASNTTSVVLNGHVLTISPTSTSTSSFGGTISDGTGGKGSVVVDGAGTVTLSGHNTFGGGITIDAGTLELGNANAAGTGAITFANDPTLEIDGTIMPTNAIDGFISGDAIDLTSIANVAGSHADMNYSTNVLTITEGSNTYTLNFNPAESFAGDYFHLAADAAGAGTEITENSTPCYCRGTLIRTDRGDVPVEELGIGDAVATASGKRRPIKWIGRRSYGGRFVLGRKDILPICVKTGALDDNVPCRDLWISPHHAMYLEGVLIEARDLANGTSIVQAEKVEKVEYFHVELEEHDVIIAEGALSESFVDDDSRAMFHNAHEYRMLYPDGAAPLARYCALRCGDGHAVEAARRHIALRAGLNSPERQAQTGALRGYVDIVQPDRIAGWAQNADYPDAPVCLDIYANGRLIGQTLANRYRADLENAGIGGRHGFAFTPAAGIRFAVDTVEVRRSLDGAALPATARVQGAPVRLAG